ncbi:MAG: hemerythrin family protein [Oligoflexia bacterium]|nr:hemerythrin family protein [Oligoflexia bacterium]
MELFIQNTIYKIHLESMDKQHMEHLGIINNLYNQKDVFSEDCCYKLISSLFCYTNKYFRVEEESMMEHRYPRFWEHRDEHLQIINEITKYNNLLNEKNDFRLVAKNIGIFLCRWFCSHNLISDYSYAHYINSITYTTNYNIV